VRLSILFVVAGLIICRSLGAAVIISTFSDTPPGYVGGGYQIHVTNLPFSSSNQQWAMAFTLASGQNYKLTGIRVPLAFQSNAEVDFGIARPDALGAPGIVLEKIPILGSSGTTAVYAGDSVTMSILTGGNTYWLEAAILPSGPNAAVTWRPPANLFSGLALGPVASRNISSLPTPQSWSVSTETQAAFEIDGIALPEPATATMFILGGCLVGIAGWCRRLTANQ